MILNIYYYFQISKFAKIVEEGGISLTEPKRFLPSRPWDLERPEKPWEVTE
jgi:large subunit ribosomal protein L18